ncbi:Hypothetical protein Cp106_0411 [Corynebacterium pseudotuberculosis 1/06-A]|nr:Hypothetical protein Cp106_0411 [Corynebacterium pseudotuberculosis 1/06-A]
MKGNSLYQWYVVGGKADSEHEEAAFLIVRA